MCRTEGSTRVNRAVALGGRSRGQLRARLSRAGDRGHRIRVASLTQAGFELVEGLCLGPQISLRVLASEREELARLFRPLDAFGDDFYAEISCERDHARHDRRVALLARDVLNEAAIDLQSVDRQCS